MQLESLFCMIYLHCNNDTIFLRQIVNSHERIARSSNPLLRPFLQGIVSSWRDLSTFVGRRMRFPKWKLKLKLKLRTVKGCLTFTVKIFLTGQKSATYVSLKTKWYDRQSGTDSLGKLSQSQVCRFVLRRGITRPDLTVYPYSGTNWFTKFQQFPAANTTLENNYIFTFLSVSGSRPVTTAGPTQLWTNGLNRQRKRQRTYLTLSAKWTLASGFRAMPNDPAVTETNMKNI